MDHEHSGSSHDVRMKGFLRRHPVQAALEWVDAQVRPLEAEPVPLLEASGRILSQAIASSCDVPQFDRAMMDGYAVRAGDTAGAGPYQPLPLAIMGDAFPGVGFSGEVGPGQAVRIMTGAPLPRGADSVLPAEWSQAEGETVLAIDQVPPGKHVGRRGEDVRANEQVFSAGRTLRPQDVGLLGSLGLDRVWCVRRPRVRIVVTGSELVPRGREPSGWRIADANGPMLSALVARDGGTPDLAPLAPDDPAALLDAMDQPADLLIVAGGTSVGLEDHVPRLVAQHGQLALHGLAMRPSSPTGMGLFRGRPVLLLPGNPVSCLCGYDFFAGRAVRLLGGRPALWPYQKIFCRLARKISSAIGRVDYARVCLREGLAQPLAIGGASILSSTTRADGFVVVEQDSEGFAAGAEAPVWLYD